MQAWNVLTGFGVETAFVQDPQRGGVVDGDRGAQGQGGVGPEVLQQGVDHFGRKPLTPVELAEQVAQMQRFRRIGVQQDKTDGAAASLRSDGEAVTEV